MVETSSSVLLKNLIGTSFIAERGLLWGVGELHTLPCWQRKLGKAVYSTAWPSLMGNHSSILGCLGVQMEEEITATASIFSKRNNNLGACYSFPVTWNWQASLKGSCVSRLSQQN